MTAERPDISIDAVYSQAEAARLLKVDRHTLRRWEKDPVFPPGGLDPQGRPGEVLPGPAAARPVDGEIDPNLPGKREAINTKNGYLKPNPGRVRLSSRFP